MKKINVIGTSGSGKTTFSRRLANTLEYPYIEMDKLFWGPNWYWPTDEEFFQKIRVALEAESWVLDGNYNRTLEIKWRNVDTVIWLDYSFSRTLFQAVKRALTRSLTKEEIWEGTGNRESFKKSFMSKDSIILWTIKTHSNVRQRYLDCMTDPKYAHIQFFRIKNPSEAEKFLRRNLNI